MPFPKELSVGNRILDSEHKKLHDIIKVITHSVETADVAALLEAFELLEKCLCAYFAVEENIAQAVSFDFTQHTLAHQDLLNKIQRIKDELVAKNGMWPEREKNYYIQSLRNCLIQHIKEDGKPFKIVLSTYLYDFRPDSADVDPVLH